jgi:hypothetical protein
MLHGEKLFRCNGNGSTFQWKSECNNPLRTRLTLCTEIPDLYSVEADSLLSFRYSTIFLCIDMWNHGPRRSLADYIRLPQPYLSSAIYKEIPLQVAQSLKMKSFRSALKTTLGELVGPLCILLNHFNYSSCLSLWIVAVSISILSVCVKHI